MPDTDLSALYLITLIQASNTPKWHLKFIFLFCRRGHWGMRCWVTCSKSHCCTPSGRVISPEFPQHLTHLRKAGFSCTLYSCCCHPWSESESVSHSVMSNSLWFHGLKPTRLLYPWNFPGKNIGMGSHSLLERIFQTQGLNPGLLHCRWILYHLSHMNPFQVPPMELFSPFSSVQSLSHVRLFATPWTAALQASYPSPTPGVYSNSCPLSQWCHPTISSSVIPFSSHFQSFPTSGSFQMSQFFISGGQSIGSSFNISPSSEHPGLIFRMDWLDLFAVQGTLKSLLQHHSTKASILWHSAFFIVRLSHPYMTTGKTIALTR